MRRLHRHRRQRKKSYLPLIVVVLAIVATIWLLWFLLSKISFGSTVQTSFTVSSSTPEQISVRIGEDWNQNVTDIKLYEKNELRTNNGFATMYSAIGEELLLDHNTDLEIIKASSSDDSSRWHMKLSAGTIFVTTKTQSMPIERVMTLADFSVNIPDGVQAFITSNGVHVLQDNTVGLALEFDSLEEPIIVGEGQSFTLDSDAIPTTVDAFYALRKPLQRELIPDRLREQVRVNGTTSDALPLLTTITIDQPIDKAEINTSTVQVSGKVTEDITTVEINNESITLNDANEFSVELSVPLGSFTIATIAKNAEGVTVEEDIRTITRTQASTAQPLTLTITEPVAAGQTFTTNSDTVIIRGTVGTDAMSIKVNDYTLQLYEAGEATWQYIAQTALNNFSAGTNTYRVQATTADGTTSPEQIITIIKSDAAAVSSQSTSSQSSTSVATSTSAAIIRTGPTAAATYQTSNDNIVIEGTIRGQAASVWVSGYQLQLFNPERGIWNYLANTDLQTLTAGTNTYRIEARDADGTVLDSNTLTITYTPSAE